MRENNYREFACRLVILFIGLTIAHLGVTLFLLSNLGADPFNVLIQGLRQQIENAGWNLTHGTVHMAVSFLIILVLLIVDRHYVKAGTLICMFCGGPIIDFFSWLLKSLNIGGASLPVKIPVLVLGCVILAFGMTIVIRSEAGTGPNDLVAVVISEKSGIRFGITRVATDALFVLVGFLLGGKVGIGTISPSFYADMYKRNVQERILNMLRDLNIQNGPVFMQGFVDDDTVRFYDPGYRFPGSEYDTMFSRIWDMDIMKMMVEFALTGKMDNQYCKLLPDMSELKGHAVITLFPAMKEGYIAAIEGLDAIAAMPEVIGYTLRHNVGENVPFTRNVNQRFGEFDVIAEDYAALKKLIAKILSTLHVKDPSGNELLYGNIDVDKLP